MIHKILILGASSAIAQETARLFCSQSPSFCLVGRSHLKLNSVKKDLLTRGAEQVFCEILEDIHSIDSAKLKDRVMETLGIPDLIFVAWGYLPGQNQCETNYSEFEKSFQINFLSVVCALTPFINLLKEKGTGTIAVISSVAGDRGRQSNFAYGAAKGALNRWLQGMRNALWHSGVHVLTIKPGFIETPMTENVNKGFLFVKPRVIAPLIKQGILKKQDEIYVPGFWKLIMGILCLIPEGIFKRLRL